MSLEQAVVHPDKRASHYSGPSSQWSWIVSLSAALFQIFVAIRFWSLTWDDSAITLGFARTFASTGRIEPSPGSGIVEGFSTLSWMFLMALVAKLTTPHGLLVTAKLFTLGLNLINLLLIRTFFCRFAGALAADLTAGVIGAFVMPYETINGMETPLLMFLLLAMALLAARRQAISQLLLLLLGSLLVLTRFEAIWWTLPFIILAPTRPLRLARTATWAVVFAAASLWRHRYFGLWLPNTIIAKHGQPYSPTGFVSTVLVHLEGIQYPLLLLLALSTILFVASGRHLRFYSIARIGHLWRNLGSAELQALLLCLGITIASLLLSLGVGRNWGPRAREFYPAWPFAVFLVINFVGWTRKQYTNHAEWSLSLRPSHSLALVFTVSLLMVYTTWKLASPFAPVYMSGVTVDNVAALLNPINQLRNASGKQQITYAGPDIGGVMLYENDISIVDLGLLCDPVLAKQRSNALDPYVLKQRHPDIIEVHSFWTPLLGFDHDLVLLSGYQILLVNGFRFFVSNNLIARIPPRRLAQKDFAPDGTSPLLGTRERLHIINYAHEEDRILDERFKHYLVLLPPPQASH